VAAPGVTRPAPTRLGVSRLATLRIVVVYGAILAAASLGLEWLQYRYLVRTYSFEVYVGLVAIAFLCLGLWAGARLFRRAPSAVPFEPNTRVQQTLGISERELEVLHLLAVGGSNKEIASRLGVSPNTVKTHLAKLYGKLDVKRRTEAIRRARELGMLR
jgi:DNA-binding CsgD family transcriptional regulator